MWFRFLARTDGLTDGLTKVFQEVLADLKILQITMSSSHINAINVTMKLLIHAIWGYIWKYTAEKSQTNVTSVNMPAKDTLETTQWRKVKQMQPVWICLFSSRQFEETFENTKWGQGKQMQPMWLCVLLCKRFEVTFKNSQRRKVEQMQPVWLCILWCK